MKNRIINIRTKMENKKTRTKPRVKTLENKNSVEIPKEKKKYKRKPKTTKTLEGDDPVKKLLAKPSLRINKPITRSKDVRKKRYDPNKDYTIEEIEATMSLQQIAFCRQFIKSAENRTEAYIYAYPNQNPTNARTSAYQLLQKSHIQKYVELLRADIERVIGVNKHKMIDRLAFVAFTNAAEHLYYDNWELKPLDEIPKEYQWLVDAITVRTSKYGTTVSAKTISKQWAIEMICKVMGYLVPETKTDIVDSNDKLLGSGNVNSLRQALGLDNLEDPTK